MSETEIEEYIIDTKEGKGHFTLRVSLFDERVKLLITAVERPNKKYYNLVRLAQLKEACVAFEKISTIKDALNILKNNIESGNILISSENEDVIDVKFVLKIKGKTYSPFFIGLPIDNDPEPDNNPKEESVEKNDEKQNYEVLPVKFDYQGNKEAELKYGQSTKSTTEYVKPIIQADVKEPNLILEYIEPVLQVHYPDGTTKSTALPPRLQTEDGKEPNIAPEQLKTIHEQIAKNFNQSLIDYEKEKNRANSVSRKNPPNNFSRQTVNVHNFTNMTNLTPNLKSFENINNNVNDINAVRSAMKPNINMNINMNMNTLNNYNIRQVRTQFNPYDNAEERNTTGSLNTNINNLNNIMNMPLTSRNNIINLDNMRQNKLINKGLSDYSISSMPNKPLVVPNSYNYGMIPNTTIKSTSSNNNSPLIQEVPKFIDRNQNINASNYNNYNNYNNIIMLQKGLNKSSSSPSMQTLGKVNHNFYQQNQGQTDNFFRQKNPNNNFNNFQLTQSYQNLQSQINNVNLQMNNNNNINNMNKINSTHTTFMNYTHNPHLVKNNQNYNFNNTSQNNVLSRNYSNQNTFVKYRSINPIMNPLTQSNDEIRYQQLMNQRRLQEQQERQQLLQRTKMNNFNYAQQNNSNNLYNVNNMNNNMNMFLGNISRNPNLNNNNNNPQMSSNIKNQQGVNYAEVNILDQQINPRNRPQEPMNNLRNRNTNINVNNQNKVLQTININQPLLKQSRSQQVIRQSPSMKNEITEQQIALAQMASLQNQQNPNNFKPMMVSLNQKFLDPEGNEETQSQYERESKNIQPQIISPTLKIERENTGKKSENNQERFTSEKKPNSNFETNTQDLTPRSNAKAKIQQTPKKEDDDDIEDPEAEKLFRLENGLIIFRNGLLRGIIHKYKEIDDVVSKIQLKLMAGAKFMLLYRASTDGDKAKIFHQKCDNHPMTLVLVETTKGVRFGGFTMKTWDGNCAKKIDNEAFVFSFDKRKCYDIVKNEHAIGAYPKFGPVFFGCQIRIYDEFFTKGGTTCNRGLNYKTKQDYELNNGEQKYIVKEIEVYNIEAIEV